VATAAAATDRLKGELLVDFHAPPEAEFDPDGTDRGTISIVEHATALSKREER